MANTPQTLTRTDHCVSIRYGGAEIGNIQEWSPNQSRTVTPLYEINAAGTGNILEQVPGVIGGTTITVNRYDLYTAKMEDIWNPEVPFLNMLTDQNQPLMITERWDNPDGSLDVWVYTGCWFMSLGRTHSAVGDRITKVNATLAYVRRYKVSESSIRSSERATRVLNRAFGL
jgi:hypothetical protein